MRFILPEKKKEPLIYKLICKDRFPFQVYAGIDNTGNDVTGNNRLFAGFNWGNVFWTDQRLSYQWVTSSDFKRYRAHTLYYKIPLPWWQHMLNLYEGYSHVDADYGKPKGGSIRKNDEFQFLVFYDYGLSGVKHAATGQPKTSYLMSMGPGVRYNVIPYLTFRADWGFQLHNLELGGPHQRLHFSLSVGY